MFVVPHATTCFIAFYNGIICLCLYVCATVCLPIHFLLDIRLFSMCPLALVNNTAINMHICVFACSSFGWNRWVLLRNCQTVFQNGCAILLIHSHQRCMAFPVSPHLCLHLLFSLKKYRAILGEGNGNPLQRSCLENPRDGRAWWAAIYGFAQSWTGLKRLSSSSGCEVVSQCGFRLHFPNDLWQPTPVLLPGKSHGWRSLVW